MDGVSCKRLGLALEVFGSIGLFFFNPINLQFPQNCDSELSTKENSELGLASFQECLAHQDIF